MPNLPNLNPRSSGLAGGATANIHLDMKYVDCVDLTADNISCKTLSIDGEQITTNFTTDKVTTKELIAVNRDLSICDANGNGNPGTNPNAGYENNMFWGVTEFGSKIKIKKLLNPGDIWDPFGVVAEISNPDAKTYTDGFGVIQPANTILQFGNNYRTPYDAILMAYRDYGSGNYRNSFIINPNSLLASPYASFCLRMPPQNLNVDVNVTAKSIVVTNNSARVLVNFFKPSAPLLEVGMTVTVKATPNTFNVTNAVITSVESGSSTYINYPCIAPDGTSTAIESFYSGPSVFTTTPNSTTIYVKYVNGPIPQVGQNIYIRATPSSLNTPSNGTPIKTVTVGVSYTTLTCEVTTPIASVTQATAITEVTLKSGSPYTSNDPLGVMANVGIHNSVPRAPLDVNGNVIFRDRATRRPLLKTSTEGATESIVRILSTATDGEFPFAEFDAFNSQFKVFNTATGNDLLLLDSMTNTLTFASTETGKYNLFEMNALTNKTLFKNTNDDKKVIEIDHSLPSLKILGPITQTNGFALFYPNSNKVAFGKDACDELIADPDKSLGFSVSQVGRFVGNLVVESNSDLTKTSDLRVGKINQYSLLRTDVANTRVGINITSPSYTLHVNGTTRVNTLISDYSYQTSPPCIALVHTATSLANNTLTSLLFGTKDTILDNGTTGPVSSVWTNANVGLTHTYSAGSGKFTNTSATEKRYYRVDVTVGFTSNATGFRQIEIDQFQVGGTTPVRSYGRISTDGVSGVTWLSTYSVIALAANEWFTIGAFQTSGAALNTYSTLGGPDITTVRVFKL